MGFPHVLLVDDDVMVTRALTRVLAMHCKISVRVASSSLQALEFLEQEPFTLLVADFSLPGISAPELFKIAHERWPAMKRAILTGHDKGWLGADDLALADEFMEKSTSPSIVAKRICELASAG